MKQNKSKWMTLTALLAAVLCILGPMSLPIGPVPVTLTNLALYLITYLVDMPQAVCAYGIYMLLGLFGLPVFSGFSGGVGKVLGPTGGYLIGFLPMTVMIALFVGRYAQRRLLCILVMEAATWVAYLFGSAWLSWQSNMGFWAALGVGVFPFVLVDLCKIVAAVLCGPLLRRRLYPVFSQR